MAQVFGLLKHCEYSAINCMSGRRICILKHYISYRDSTPKCVSIVTRRRHRASVQFPLPEEVVRLNALYPAPQQIVDQLLSYVIGLDKNCKPVHKLRCSLRNTHWKAQLFFKWPVKFHVCGISDHPSRAEHYAYLVACDMFQTLGLLFNNPASSDEVQCEFKERLLKFHHHFSSDFGLKSPQCIGFKSLKEKEGEQVIWKSHVHLNLFYSWKVCGQGLTRSDAENVAAAMAFVKLKALKLLDRGNCRLHAPAILCLPFSNKTEEWDSPDYEFYVDASPTGYGAYLVGHTVPDNETVHWIREPWPEQLFGKFPFSRKSSNFLEFHAALAAVFTWKRKFENKRITCLSDNNTAVNLINEGLPLRNKSRRITSLPSFQVLSETCAKYSIHLKARHLKRKDNQAADHLSHSNEEQFRKMVPNARLKPKKGKKLLFFTPFDIINLPEHLSNSRGSKSTLNQPKTSLPDQDEQDRFNCNANHMSDLLPDVNSANTAATNMDISETQGDLPLSSNSDRLTLKVLDR